MRITGDTSQILFERNSNTYLEIYSIIKLKKLSG